MIENIFIYFFAIVSIGILIYLFKGILSTSFNPIVTRTNPQVFYKKVKDGYITLLNSLYHNSDKEDLEKTITNLVSERSDGRYFGGYTRKTNEFDFSSFSLDLFYDLIRYGENKEQNFILDLHKNLSLKDLNSFLKKSLAHLGNQSFLTQYTEKFAFPYTEILSSYQHELKKNSIKIGFLSDGFNSYYLIIFPLVKEKILKKAILDVGLEYKDTLMDEEKVANEIISNIGFESPAKIAFV